MSNLRVRITDIASSTSRDFSIDWIPVRVSYNPPAATATATATPSQTPTATATPSQTPTFTPTPLPPVTITIDYVYDPLNRLTEANYSNGNYYHYFYDAVGNRETQTTFIGGVSSTTNYVYDDANRLASLNGVNYTWDNNGNLLNDGVNTYTYDSAREASPWGTIA